MENLLSCRIKRNFSDENLSSLVSNSDLKPVRKKSLTEYTKTLTGNYITWFEGNSSPINTDLSNSKVIEIAQKLANAIEINSVEKIKKLKDIYGDQKEFIEAKKFINDKCKQVWNVYENPEKVPIKAMKALGVTNQPSLEYLLDNTIKYFEKDGEKTTAKTISSILNNKYIDYNINDIHKYLTKMNRKENCKYNSETIKYLILTHNYNEPMLLELGKTKKEIDEIFKTLPLKYRVKHLAKKLSLCFN